MSAVGPSFVHTSTKVDRSVPPSLAFPPTCSRVRATSIGFVTTVATMPADAPAQASSMRPRTWSWWRLKRRRCSRK
eukprot:624967-Rhodomonas_salina.2